MSEIIASHDIAPTQEAVVEYERAATALGNLALSERVVSDSEVEQSIQALENDVAEEAAVEQQYVQEGIAAAEAYANGADVRAEDADRVHNIDAAYEEAMHENTMIEAYNEAMQEEISRAQAIAYQEEMDRAHTEALQEDADRIYAAAVEENAEREKQKIVFKQEAAKEADSEQGEQPPTPIKDTKAEDLQDKEYRKHAAAVLESVGYTESIPVNSQVIKDPESGNIMIVHNQDVKVLEPQPNGTVQVTEYDYNRDTNIVTIRRRGEDTITARVANYAEATIEDEQKYWSGTVKLPPTVAKIVGFKEALPVAQMAEA